MTWLLLVPVALILVVRITWGPLIEVSEDVQAWRRYRRQKKAGTALPVINQCAVRDTCTLHSACPFVTDCKRVEGL